MDLIVVFLIIFLEDNFDGICIGYDLFKFFVYVIGNVCLCRDKGERDVLNSRYIEKWIKEVWGNVFFWSVYFCLLNELMFLKLKWIMKLCSKEEI